MIVITGTVGVGMSSWFMAVVVCVALKKKNFS